MGKNEIRYRVYTDGSCRKSPGPGGWAAVVFNDFQKEHLIYTGGFRYTTYNRMALLSVINGIQCSPITENSIVEIYTDSSYISNAFNKKLIYKWVKSSFMDKGLFIPDHDLWANLWRAYNQSNVEFHWLPKRNGELLNRICNDLARDYCTKINLPPDYEYEKIKILNT